MNESEKQAMAEKLMADRLELEKSLDDEYWKVRRLIGRIYIQLIEGVRAQKNPKPSQPQETIPEGKEE